MSEYIIREEVYQKLHEAGGCGATDEWEKGYDDGITEAIRIINEMPAADVAPVVHGHWKWVYRDGGKLMNQCDQCKETTNVIKRTPFCPNCGAEMDESEDNK